MVINTRLVDEANETTIDEGYWSALLTEGEFSRSAMPEPLHHGNHNPHTDLYPIYEAPTPAADLASDWLAMMRVMERDEVLELAVIGYNRGGLLVEWESLRGFVPASQLISDTGHPQTRRYNLANRVGDVLRLRVIELDPEKNRLVLSERAAQVGQGVRAKLLDNLQVGDTVSGIITNLCDFGAFVDLGGVEGLVHISELSWGRVNHPSDILKRKQHVQAMVMSVHLDEGRVALSIKRLTPDPWETVQERYRIGQIIEGEITNVVDFGAFACVETGLEGLIHFSELAEGYFLHPRDVVNEGQIVQARILNIDGQARRLGLSLRLA